MKIGFFYNNISNSRTDFTSILNGNPGVGGTDYLIVTISYLLSVRGNIDVTLYLQKQIDLPSDIKCIVVDDQLAASEQSEKDAIDYLIIDSKSFDKTLLYRAQSYDTKYILWCHNFEGYYNSKLYAKSDRIAKILSVGREESEIFLDDIDIYSKSDYIYNGVAYNGMLAARQSGYQEWSSRKNNVVFIGNLGWNKGFNILARAWRDVLNKVPDANLYVIGALDLYGSCSEKDRYYYDRALSYIQDVDSTGDVTLMKSVHLCGVMGDEKNDILKMCKVGVPNPGGGGETFGLAAVEMQSMGCLITTMKCSGFIDTVYSNGILYDSAKSLANSIVELLNRSDNNDLQMLSFIKDNFSFDVVIETWEEFLLSVDDKIPHSPKDREYPYFCLKPIKRLMRSLKLKCKLLRKIPSVQGLLNVWGRVIEKNNIHNYG